MSNCPGNDQTTIHEAVVARNLSNGIACPVVPTESQIEHRPNLPILFFVAKRLESRLFGRIALLPGHRG